MQFRDVVYKTMGWKQLNNRFSDMVGGKEGNAEKQRGLAGRGANIEGHQVKYRWLRFYK
ncbi:MAG: hypothetical protein WCC17_23025 [Candidatus Nitrosopolaris sp.]